MSSIDIIKPLSTVLSSVIDKSQQHQEKNSQESQELNPGPLGAKQEHHPLCYKVTLIVSAYADRINLPRLDNNRSTSFRVTDRDLGTDSRLIRNKPIRDYFDLKQEWSALKSQAADKKKLR